MMHAHSQPAPASSCMCCVCCADLLYAVADLTKNPVEGFSAGLVDDSNIFEWTVTIIGPPDTL